MKGDFSRLRFGDWHRYSRVMQQQGRVLLDSDWNAGATAFANRFDQFGRLLTGPRPGAGPVNDLGFAIDGIRYASINSDPELDPGCVLLNADPSLPFERYETERKTTITITEHEVVEALELTIGDVSLLEVIEEDIIEVDVETTETTVENVAGAYTISVDLAVALRDGSTLLHHTGSYSIGSDASGHLIYRTDDGSVLEKTRHSVVRDERFFALSVVSTGRTLIIHVDGVEVLRLPAPPLARTRPDMPPLHLCAFLDQSDSRLLHPADARLSGLRIWRLAMRGAALAMLDRHDRRALRDYLVCDLDFDNLNEGFFRDLSGFRNAGIPDPFDSPVEFGVADLTIGKGLYLLGGTALCNPSQIRFRDQPFLHRPHHRNPVWDAGATLAYLETWPRFVTPTEAPRLAEPALGGAQTTGRVEDIWQVRLLFGDTAETCLDLLGRLQQTADTPGRLAMRHRDPMLTAPGNRLYRVEIANGGCADQHDSPYATRAMIEFGASAYLKEGGIINLIDTPFGDEIVPGSTLAVLVRVRERYAILRCRVVSGDTRSVVKVDLESHEDWRDRVDHVVHQLLGHDASDDDADPIAPTDVDLDDVLVVPLARYRFSDENASVAFAVSQIVEESDAEGHSLGRVTLDGLREALSAIAPGDWVELSNDPIALDRRPGPMYQVGNIDFALMQLELIGWNGTDSHVSLARHNHPILRKWSVRDSDRQSQSMHAAGMAPDALISAPFYPVRPGHWHTLEHGIQARFSAGGWYARGAYWTAPTRDTGTRQLDWPGPSHRPALVAPQGPVVRRAPLATFQIDDNSISPSDLRCAFGPLPDAGSGGGGGSHGGSTDEAGALASAMNDWALDQGLSSDDYAPADISSAFMTRTALAGDTRLLVPQTKASDIVNMGLGLEPAGSLCVNTFDALVWSDTTYPDDALPFDGPTRAFSCPDGRAVWIASFDNEGPVEGPDYHQRKFSVWHLSRDAGGNNQWRRIDQTFYSAPGYLMGCVKAGMLALFGLFFNDRSEMSGLLLETSGQTYPLGLLPFENRQSSTVALGPDIYVTGGEACQEGRLFRLRGMNDWEETSPAYWRRTQNRYGAATITYDHRIYRFGGVSENDRQLEYAECFDPRLPGWIGLARLQDYVAPLAATASPFGPIISDAVGNVWRYDIETDRFDALTPTSGRVNGALAVLGRADPVLFALGGRDRSTACASAPMTERYTLLK